MNRVLVCFEDRLTPQSDPADFGPFRLLVSCVADDLAATDPSTTWQRRRRVAEALISRPLNGSGNLRRFCGDPERQLKNFRAGIAVFDFDRVAELFPKAEQAAIRRLCKVRIRARLGEPQIKDKPIGPLHVALLDENTESLLAACPSPSATKPTPAMRDQTLLPVWTTEDRAGRDTLRGTVGSFDYIVVRVLGLLRAP